VNRTTALLALVALAGAVAAGCAGDEHSRRGAPITTPSGLPAWTGVPGTGIETVGTFATDVPTVPPTTTTTIATTTTTTRPPTTLPTTTTSTTTPVPPATTTTSTTLPPTTASPCSNTITTPADLLFAAKSSVLLPGAAQHMETELEPALAAGTIVGIDITGHTDSRHPPGDDNYNLQLSQARADTVAFVVVAYLGIDPTLVHATGLAYTQPVVDDGGPDPSTYEEALGRQNRRVVIVVYTTTCTEGSS